ncbi:MAG: glycerol-3-phosphate dehydrogenase subunit GlpB [Desulfobacterales bacterium]|nr:glycerol-3-phosphate dehydrogenase subunit GlpB [Desulfobacterales bacterium]
MSEKTIECDLLIIGAGMSGIAASFFASNRGISTVQVGMSTSLSFSSGLLDLMAVHPIETINIWDDPWTGIDALNNDIPNHPYSKIKKEKIKEAFNEIVSFLKQTGINYVSEDDKNTQIITSAGTIKHTYLVPESMWNGAVAYAKKAPCLFIDFHGLKGFSSRQITESLSDNWPNLRSAQIYFPDSFGENFCEHIARSLEKPEMRTKLVESIKPYLHDSKYIAFPAVMGMYSVKEIMSDIEQKIGLPIFEIPTMPPSVPGIRLKNAFEKRIVEKGVKVFFKHKIIRVNQDSSGEFISLLGDGSDITIVSKALILASGRFLGKGLHAERKEIKETIFGLPVYQPESRTLWHENDFFDPKGHAINQSGIETDELLRPINSNKKPFFDNLFAIGTILAHQDWTRMKCGSGLSIATAYAAVNNLKL